APPTPPPPRGGGCGGAPPGRPPRRVRRQRVPAPYQPIATFAVLFVRAAIPISSLPSGYRRHPLGTPSTVRKATAAGQAPSTPPPLQSPCGAVTPWLELTMAMKGAAARTGPSDIRRN